MSTYVVSSCFMKNPDLRPYVSDVLFKFIGQNSLKIGVDNENIIINLYEQIAENNHIIYTWIDMMAHHPTYFEKIATVPDDLEDEKEIFLYTSSQLVSNKKMIVDTIQKFKDFEVLDANKINYCGKIIQILEKDDAVEELKNPIGNATIIQDSNVAIGGSTIKDVKSQR